MKLLTRIRTFKDRLKLRLIEDQLHEYDAWMVTAVGPAWLALADNRHRLETTQRLVEERLYAQGVDPMDFAMGNLEITASIMALVSVAVLLCGLGVPAFVEWVAA